MSTLNLVICIVCNIVVTILVCGYMNRKTAEQLLEYYYSDSSKKQNQKFAGLKKQTRYSTQFVYVYDESKFKYNQMSLTISCPNCGAPLNKLGEGNCQYCGTYIKPINLKGWYMVSYKDEYK